MKSESESCSVMSYSLQPHGLHTPWNFPGQDTGVGTCSLLQGILPIQGLNPGLPHCRQILYQLSYQGRPRTLEWVAYPFSGGSSWPRNRTRVSCIAGGFFTNGAIREFRMWVKDCPNLELTLGKFLLLKTVAFVFLLVSSLFDTFNWLGRVPHLTRLSD